MQTVMQAVTPAAAAPPLSRSQMRRAVLASVIGNGLEWFDFLIYGYFARVIAQVFFPANNSFVSITLTLATFAIGFLVRPLGGIVIGACADRYGRRKTLSLLILLMALSTLMMGLTPSYATIGIAAPLIVIVARILQGLSVGGEFATAAAMLTEYAPPRRKMFFGSFQMTSQAVALLLSSLCSLLLTTRLSHESLVSWGWRVPFLLGALVGPVGFYIRHKVGESPEFLQLRERLGHAPRQSLRTFIRERGDAALCAMGVIIVGAATNYLWHSYMPLYVEHQLHLPLKNALFGTAMSGLIGIVGYPLAGRLADRFGAYRLFFPVTIAWVCVAYPLFAWVLAAPSAERVFTAQMIATVVLSLMSGAHPGMLTQLFPTSTRSTGVALSYNVAVTLFGGLAPLTVSTLIDVTGSRLVPAWYLICAGVISLLLVGLTASGRRLVRKPDLWLADGQ
ncbi:Proline/betaine transporter [Paraburkholderia graminis C4D1M]|uniref:Major facilitator superfamily MFS_1 n=1 Tax=Paraburkholderia graminis (strain ATCC 700544 / DSM 17151 / LMG 18924 / NCIMB 13744 / C4D1M) TaxID=396598 RepID=B1FYE3_PARG4|nr:MFS transporter [Paraburkholderia graminis]EDT10784.1 major facilitator superfamily MFS_1 [Paraburkholderia graminis C4D1M]CAB3717240.1 Proline/betaine transporter [Paraburkholderia graminis C4D1M]